MARDGDTTPDGGEPPRGGWGRRAELRVEQVRPAYEQVTEQLRRMIVDGEVTPGERLPKETELGTAFGVSRSTIREALRILSAQGFIVTAKGPTGGSFIASPTVDDVSEFLQGSIGLLRHQDSISTDELLEARRLLEVPAAGLAASRRSEDHLAAMRAAVPDHLSSLPVLEQYKLNRAFHIQVVRAAGNNLVLIACQPIFAMLQSSMARTDSAKRIAPRVIKDHLALIAAIEAGDSERAQRVMEKHLSFLSPEYERIFRKGARPGDAAAPRRGSRRASS